MGVLGGAAYGALTYRLLSLAFLAKGGKEVSDLVSVAFIFVTPMVMGAIPVAFATQEQLKNYFYWLVLPWLSILVFLFGSVLIGSEGAICTVVVVAPFLFLGSLGGFLIRLYYLKRQGRRSPLYSLLLLPYLFAFGESAFQPSDDLEWVSTRVEIAAPAARVWSHVKEVKEIRREELPLHFVHAIGVPRPLDGRLNHEGVGAVRSITWEKGIRFQERIKAWEPGRGFAYDIHVDPASIPPETLDQHVIVGGRYFDVLEGSYALEALGPQRSALTLKVRYRVTSTLNFYCRWWAEFMLNDFNEVILDVVKARSETGA